jgi:RNA polymerase sigma factor (sigma-70 family)
MFREGPSSTQDSLVERVKSWEDKESWEIFARIYRPLIQSFSIKCGLDHEEAQEVAQDTLVEVAHRIKNKEYQRDKGSFRAWLFRLTRWRITNQFKKRPQGVIPLELAENSEASESVPSEFILDGTDESWEEDWRQALLEAGMKKLRHSIKPKHFQVLHALLLQGWSVAKVAQTLGMPRGQVYLIKLRGTLRLKKQIARLRATEFTDLVKPRD